MLTSCMAWLIPHLIAKNFSLSGSDINHMIKSLDNRTIVDIDMSNQSSYLIFDTYI